MNRTVRELVMPAGASGVLMAAYLLLRPYGDSGVGHDQAQAFASPWWVVAHVCGLLAIAQFARLVLRLSEVDGGVPARTARTAGLAGAVLVAPYYGAETFALHVVGRGALADPALLGLAEQIRNQQVALDMFGVGLLLLAVSGVALGLVWQRRGGRGRWAGWPLGLGMVLLLPQFYLPVEGRMAFGLAYAAAAAVFVVAARNGGRQPRSGRQQAPVATVNA